LVFADGRFQIFINNELKDECCSYYLNSEWATVSVTSDSDKLLVYFEEEEVLRLPLDDSFSCTKAVWNPSKAHHI